jgi:hypothetical protein
MGLGEEREGGGLEEGGEKGVTRKITRKGKKKLGRGTMEGGGGILWGREEMHTKPEGLYSNSKVLQ